MDLWRSIPGERHVPDFDNILKVLKRERPDRPVLYELFLNGTVYAKASGATLDANDRPGMAAATIRAFRNLGYDYASIWGLYDFGFPRKEKQRLQTISLNDAQTITDWASYEAYRWPDPAAATFLPDDWLLAQLPGRMRLLPLGPGGVLENVIGLVGYETLCLILADDPALGKAIFDAVGSRLVKFYERLLEFRSVGAVVGNDDWGFKTQTMLAPADMRTYVFPWHTRIVAAAHAAGKPILLHSCGYPTEVMEDVIEVMRYDGRHSYEDTIVRVEDFYERWGRRIAVLGGIDLDFICRSTPAQIQARGRALLEQTAARGGYALGSGNSIPEYIPEEKYLAMISLAWRT
jgi:uroporphyrinogen decarboxylase